MTELRLVVTGECERVALAGALQSCFPGVSFARSVKVDSFTSAPLTDPPSRGSIDTLDKFTRKLIELTDEHDDALIVGVDDLELDGNAADVASAVRNSVRRVVDELAASASRKARLQEALCRRCSFHLLVPMVEAYFFRDPDALRRAGAVIASRFDATGDVEAFVVDDAEYLAAPETTQTSEPNAERRKRSWAKPVDFRRRHPKHYLKYLTSPKDCFGSRYRESKHGAAALGLLAWQRVTATGTHVRSARALLNDIADFLAVRAYSPGDEAIETSRSTPRPNRVLRNL